MALPQYGHADGDGDGLQAERAAHAPTGVAGEAARLVDHLRDPVQVRVGPGGGGNISSGGKRACARVSV